MRGVARLAATAFLLASAARAGGLEPVLGCTIPAWWHDSYATAGARESIRRLAATGATWVAFSPTLYVADKHASEVRATQGTATDESLRAAIRSAKAAGMRVMLKPHVDLPDSFPRMVINPVDPDKWFASYRVHMRRWAVLAREEKVEMYVVGTEIPLVAHSGHRARWLPLIAEVRALYPGPLTYAANSHAFAFVGFWDKLDYIGIDAYFPVAGGSDVEALRAGWKMWVPSIAATAAYHKKPVIFTEAGISSQKGANLRPWDWGDFGELDLETQRAYYQAMLEAVGGEPWFRGFLCWDWNVDPSAGGPADKTLNVQGKPVQALLENVFRRAQRPMPAANEGFLKKLERFGRRLAGLPDPF